MTKMHQEDCGTVYTAYTILRIGFAILAILAGIDKFLNILGYWPQYLSPQFNVTGNAHITMMIVGVIEIIAGLGIVFLPRIFSWIVAVWLLAIAINLCLIGYYDIALRDLVLMLAALALGVLSLSHVCHTCCGRNEPKAHRKEHHHKTKKHE